MPSYSKTTYDVGDMVKVDAVFNDTASGAVVAPDAVVCRVRKPDGTISTLAVTAAQVTVPPSTVPEAGYTAQINLTTSGDWTYRFEGTGQHQAASERRLKVEASDFS